MNKNDLKPCPFCGGKARLKVCNKYFIVADKNIDCYLVQCDEKDCGCGTSYESTVDKAAASWNRRV